MQALTYFLVLLFSPVISYEVASGDAGSGASMPPSAPPPAETVWDVYTIIAIVFSSLLALMVILRCCMVFVDCRLKVVDDTPETPCNSA